MQTVTHFPAEDLKVQTQLPERCSGQGSQPPVARRKAWGQPASASTAAKHSSYGPITETNRPHPLMHSIPEIPRQKIHAPGNEGICPFAVCTIS